MIFHAIATEQHYDSWQFTRESYVTVLEAEGPANKIVGIKDGKAEKRGSAHYATYRAWMVAVPDHTALAALLVAIRVHPVALTPWQVQSWDLPSRPLNPSEKRADKWRAAMGVEQTEIDAAIALVPGELSDVITTSLSAYYDPDIAGEGEAAHEAWCAQADGILMDGFSSETHDLITKVNDSLAATTDLLSEVHHRITSEALGIADQVCA